MDHPAIVDFELLKKLLTDEKNEGRTSIDVLEVRESDVQFHESLDETELDEILSRTSDAFLRVL